jgi:hypothetical protein
LGLFNFINIQSKHLNLQNTLITNIMKKKTIFSVLSVFVFSVCLTAQDVISFRIKTEDFHRGNCPENVSLVSNAATSAGNALLSSTDHGLVNYLKFDDAMIPQGSMVEGFVLWGLYAYHDGAGWNQCSIENLKVSVRFFENSNGEPGASIYEEVVASTAVTVNTITFGNWIVKRVEVNLATPVAFHQGFVSLASTDSPNCWLMGIDSEGGIPNSYIYNEQGAFVQRTVTPQVGPPKVASLGFCLLGVAPTSIVDYDSLLGISVFPNPAIGVVNVESYDAIDKVVLFDIAGRVVFSQMIQGKSISIDTSGFKGGIYILQISSGQKVQSTKIRIN